MCRNYVYNLYLGVYIPVVFFSCYAGILGMGTKKAKC